MPTPYSLRFLLLLVLLPGVVRAQTGGVRIGTAGSPDASAVLDLRPDATQAPKGLLPPRLTLAQRNAIASPATGLVIYQTDSAPGLYLYNGTVWALQGDNLGSHTATQNLNLGTYQLVGNGGSQGLSLSSTGRIGIGTTTPYSQLSNTDTNILGSDGYGGGSSSLAWAVNQIGYASMIYNNSTYSNAGGLVVKIASPTAGALDISRVSSQNAGSTSLLRVLGGGNVGIGTNSPTQLLELAGQASPTLLLHSNTNNLTNGATLQFRETLTNYGWNLRHNNGGSEGGSTDDRLILESVNDGATTPVMTWNQLTNNVGIGTNMPTTKLDVVGDARISGRLDLGLTTLSNTYSLAGGSLAELRLTCPAGTVLLGGGGGYKTFDINQYQVVLNYSGPDPDNPTTVWLIRVQNTNSSSRDIFYTCNCARLR